jgi:hypothetical protein
MEKGDPSVTQRVIWLKTRRRQLDHEYRPNRQPLEGSEPESRRTLPLLPPTTARAPFRRLPDGAADVIRLPTEQHEESGEPTSQPVA